MKHSGPVTSRRYHPYFAETFFIQNRSWSLQTNTRFPYIMGQCPEAPPSIANFQKKERHSYTLKERWVWLSLNLRCCPLLKIEPNYMISTFFHYFNPLSGSWTFPALKKNIVLLFSLSFVFSSCLQTTPVLLPDTVLPGFSTPLSIVASNRVDLSLLY